MSKFTNPSSWRAEQFAADKICQSANTIRKRLRGCIGSDFPTAMICGFMSKHQRYCESARAHRLNCKDLGASGSTHTASPRGLPSFFHGVNLLPSSALIVRKVKLRCITLSISCSPPSPAARRLVTLRLMTSASEALVAIMAFLDDLSVFFLPPSSSRRSRINWIRFVTFLLRTGVFFGSLFSASLHTCEQINSNNNKNTTHI